MKGAGSANSISGHLLRAAVVKLRDDPEVSDPIGIGWNGVAAFPIAPVHHQGEPIGRFYVAAARTRIRVRNGTTSIPPLARKTCETAIETIARLMSLDRATGFSISSPMPFVGFRPSVEANWPKVEGLLANGPIGGTLVGAVGAVSILDQVSANDLIDRLDGVALLAEAWNAGSALGRYLQLMRLFERAFKLGPGGLTEPLITFLRPSPFKFRAREVRAWTNARGFSLHADRREEFFLDTDVRPFVERMTQAGMELLANKKRWRHKSPERRDLWKPSTGTTGGMDIFLTRGHGFNMAVSLVDRFSSYPMLLAGSQEQMDPLLPKGSWMTGDVDGCELNVRGSEPLALALLSQLT